MLSNEMTDIGDRILVGLSGGADSVCLLFILLDLSEELGISLNAVHVNHCIRGEEALRDEKFCQELCNRLGVTLRIVRKDIPLMASESGLSLEETGRKARYDTFRELAEEMHCTKIAVAHHMNDQAETVLFQLFRGSRLTGMAGIKPRNDMIIRPLLCLTRKETEEYLSSINEEYVTDSTNLSDEYTRNIIRNRILVDAEAIQKKAVEHIADTAAYFARAAEYMERQAEPLYKKAVYEAFKTNEMTGTQGEDPSEILLDIPTLKDMDALLSEIVVYKALCRIAGRKKDITSEFVDDCISLMNKQTGRRINLKYNITARRVYDKLMLSTSNEGAPDYFIDNCDSNCNNELSIEEVMVPKEVFAADYIGETGGFPDGKNAKFFDTDKMYVRFGTGFSVEVRNCEKDDRICVYSDGRMKRVADVLSDMKIPENKRMSVPVVAIGNEVLLICGIRGSEACRIDERTKRITKIVI